MPLKQSKDFYQRHNHLRYAELLVHELIMSKIIQGFTLFYNTQLIGNRMLGPYL